jgi:hypothetical protein
MREDTKLAPCRRWAPRAALAAAFALLALALPAGAGAAKITSQTYVPQPDEGIPRPSPQAVAVNDSSTPDAADGRIYVADRNRILVLDSDFDFQFSFGWDTIKPGAPGNIPNNEAQTIALAGAPGSSFTLSFGGASTPPLPIGASAGQIEDALNDLPAIEAGGGSVSVSGSNPFTVAFDGGPLADTNVGRISADATGAVAAVGQSLTCNPGVLNGRSQTRGFQWYRSDGTEIAGADQRTYVTTAADAGEALQCRVVVRSVTSSGKKRTATLAFVRMPVAVTPGPATALPVPPSGFVGSPLPTVLGGGSGDPGSGERLEVGGPGGQILTCDPGSWSGVTQGFEYQWYRNSVPIAGADTDTFTVQTDELATPFNFQCVVEGASEAGSVYSASEPKSAAIGFQADPLPRPTIGGFAEVATASEGASFEICQIESNCKLGVTSEAGGAAASSSLAIDQSDGSLYLYGNRRIDKFSADGEFLWAAGRGVNADGAPDPNLCLAGDLCRAGDNEQAEPSLSGKGGIGVSPTDGRVYVGNAEDFRVQAFEPDGEFAFMWGLDVGGGGKVETCVSGCEAGASPGENQGDPGIVGGFNNIRDIAVGDQNDVYVVDLRSEANRIQRFNNPTLPTDVSAFAAGQLGSPGAALGPIAIDRGGSPDAADDSVYLVAEGVPGAGPGREVAQISAATGLVTEVHGAFEEFREGQDLAFDPDHGAFSGNRLLWAGVRADTPGNDGVRISNGTLSVLEDTTPPDPPEAEMAPVTSFDQTTATLEGSVDPNTNPTGYRFEYVDDDTYRADGESFARALRAPVEADASAGNGDSPEPVSVDIADLNPGTLYHVRLRAQVTSGPNNGSVASGGPVEFTTSPDAPTASTNPVSGKATSALLTASVDPHGEETTYVFQYGTQGPCSENPCDSTPPASAGVAGGPKLVTQRVTGLAPDATYHYRVLASSNLGEAATPDRTLVTIPQNRLPEHRALEKVTPDQKGNSAFGTRNRQASASGDALVYDTEFGTVFPGGASNPGIYNPHLSTRRADGTWSTKGLAPPLAPHALGGETYKTYGFSEDLSKQLVWLPDTVGVPGNGAYLRDNGTNTYTLVHSGELGQHFWDPAMDHVVFPEGPLYDWSEAGGVEQISKLPDGTGVNSLISAPNDHRVSAGGTRVFWSAGGSGGPAGALYASIAGEGTIEVSAPERTVPDPSPPSQRAHFQDATPDGGLVFFTSAEKLTDDSTATASSGGTSLSSELYRYDFSAPEGERLTDLTPAPDTPRGAEVRGVGVVDVSDDGRRVYFVASARLAPGGVQGTPNLYLWEEEEGGTMRIVHVGTLDPNSEVYDGGVGTHNDVELLLSGRDNQRSPMATPDGGRLLFRAAAQLTPSPTGGYAQIYLYDASEDSLECISCPPSGETPTGSGRLGVPITGLLGGQGLLDHQLRNLSANGRRAFFQTPTSLLDADSNGKEDVYEWRDGQLHLISGGSFGGDANFVDASVDGSSLFFATSERMVPTDTDSVSDAYVARVDGVPPRDLVPAPVCEGEACAPLPVPPNDPTPASSAFSGAGNVREAPAARKARCGKGKRKVKRHGKVRCVKKKAAAKRVRCGKHKRKVKRHGKVRCVKKKAARRQAKREAGRADKKGRAGR